ncbi:MAG: SRPBCC family protein [Actinomycetota bacterium]
MTQLSKSTVVEAGVDKVWDVYADFGAADVWHPYFESAALVAGSPERGVGAARDCVFGPRSSIRETVTEWIENERMVIAIEFLSGPPMPITDLMAAVDVAAVADSASTNLTLSLDYARRWGPIGAVADHLVVRRLYLGVFRNMLAASKAYAETGAIPDQLAILGSGRKV